MSSSSLRKPEAPPPWVLRSLVTNPRAQVAGVGLVAAVAVAAALFLPKVVDAVVVMLLAAMVAAWLTGGQDRLGGLVAGAVGFPLLYLLLQWADRDTSPLGPAAIQIGVVFMLVGFAVGSLRTTMLGLLQRDAEREAVLARLAEVERRQREAWEGIPVGLFQADGGGRLTAVNPAFAAMLGRTREEVVAADPAQLFVVPGEWQALVSALHSSDVVHDRVVELRHADGEVMFGRFHARVVRDEEGHPTVIDGAVRDVTSLIRSETALAEVNQLFRAAFESAPIGVMVSTPDGTFLRVNDAFGRLLGRSREELLGRRFTEITHPEDVEPNLALLRAALGGGEDTYEMEKRYLRADGSEVWTLLRASIVRDSTERPIYMIAHVVDITEMRRSAEELERLVRAKDEFVASVSHELRTPLAVVSGLASELRSSFDSFSREELTELIDLVADQSWEVASLVEDLLVAARADIGKVSVVTETVDVTAQVQTVVAAVPEGQRVQLEMWEPIWVQADPVRLRQIIRNLVTNALRYGGRQVRVAASVSGPRTLVAVSDDGPGIPEDRREAIFLPYERAHDLSGQPSSVGLGLTVSRKLARLMGGELTYSYRPGESCFLLELVSAPTPGPGYDDHQPVGGGVASERTPAS